MSSTVPDKSFISTKNIIQTPVKLSTRRLTRSARKKLEEQECTKFQTEFEAEVAQEKNEQESDEEIHEPVDLANVLFGLWVLVVGAVVAVQNFPHWFDGTLLAAYVAEPWPAAVWGSADPGPWCEHDRGVSALLREPSNAGSDLIFLGASLYFLRCGILDWSQTKQNGSELSLQGQAMLEVLCAVLNFIHFVGTFSNHACRCQLGHSLDVLGMFSILTFISLYQWFVLLTLELRRAGSSFGWLINDKAFLVVQVGILAILWPLSQRRYDDPLCESTEFIGFVCCIVPCLVAQVILAYRHPSVCYDYKKVFGALGLLLVSTVCQHIDQPRHHEPQDLPELSKLVCEPKSLVQLHAVWHLGTASALVLLFQCYRTMHVGAPDRSHHKESDSSSIAPPTKGESSHAGQMALVKLAPFSLLRCLVMLVSLLDVAAASSHFGVNESEKVVLMTVGAIVVAFMGLLQPVGQDPSYHNFADQRGIFCSCGGNKTIPNSYDVGSNFPFLVGGVVGMLVLLMGGLPRDDPVSRWELETAYVWFFVGMGLVSFGSAYYHWSPTNATLVWDRLPMTIAFVCIFAVMLEERVGDGLGERTLTPLIIVGFASVVYWHYTDDLRPYILVQGLPLLAMPVMIIFYPPYYTHTDLLLVGLGLYALAKLCEAKDAQIFSATSNTVSGHTLKHLLASVIPFTSAYMLLVRERVSQTN